MSKKFIQIKTNQMVYYDIQLEIGKDISEETASKLLNLDGETYDVETDEWYFLHNYLNHTSVVDWLEFEDVEVYKI